MDARLDLRLYVPGVPLACQQMVHGVCGVYKTLLQPPLDVGDTLLTREWVAAVLGNHGLIRPGGLTKRGTTDQTGLLAFC